MINLVDLQRQFQAIKEEVFREIEKVYDSGQYILGPKVQELEAKIAAKIGVTDAIAVGNGTDALVMVLDALGIGEGDEVITSPFTFFASAEAISRVGAIPVFADVDQASFNLDPVKVEKAITEKTKAIIPVHIFGQPADMDQMNVLAKKHGLTVIEDACQAFGASYKGKRAGSLADVACFSFFPTKNLGTIGDGGIITTSNSELAAKLRKLRMHGTSKKYYHDSIGYNSRLDEIHAAILLVVLERIDEWNGMRQEFADQYGRELASIKGLSCPAVSEDRSHIYHLYCLQSEKRDDCLHLLQANSIASGVYYPQCLHLQEVYKSLGYSKGDFPAAEKLSDTLFAVPMHPFLYKEEQEKIIQTLKMAFGGEAK